MKKNLLFLFFCLVILFPHLKSQVLYSNTFSTSLGSAVASGGSNGNWIWSNNCAQSTAGGHSAAGHAIFSGSGCQFGNGGNTVSGFLVTPTIAIGPLGGNLTFNYFLQNECQSPGNTCTYDILSLEISNNGGNSWTTIMASNGTPAGLVQTSAWTAVTYNLNSYNNQTITIRFGMNSLDGFGNAYDGVYVDDIIVNGNCPISIYGPPGNSTITSVCTGSSITLSTNAVSNFTWSTGGNASTTVVSPTANTVYSLVATSSLNCTSSASINVLVQTTPPTITVTTLNNPICLGMVTSFSAVGAINYSITGGAVNGQTFAPTTTTSYTISGINGCGTNNVVRTITVQPLAVTAAASQTLVCQGEASALSATAAASGYTWMPGPLSGSVVNVTPVSNTIYTITASDGTCVGTQTVGVNTKTTPTITAAGSAFSVCAGVNVTLTANGAGTNGTYSWVPVNTSGSQIVVSPTINTNYQVTGTNTLGCSSGTQIPVLVLTTPVITVTANKTLICAGNTVSLTANGANTYSWTSGPNTAAYNVVQTAPSMVYTVSGSVNSSTCVGTKTIAITALVPNVTVPASIAVCSGQNATLTASGANTYSWNGLSVGTTGTMAVSPASNTTYTLLANTSSANVNCYTTHSTQVIVNGLPTISVTATKSLTCKLQTNTLTATGAVTYTWSTGATGNTATVSPSTTSFYTVTGTDANGCENNLVTQAKVSTCAGIDEAALSSNLISVYPNPNSGIFKVVSTADAKVVLVDELGKTVSAAELNAGNNYSIEVAGLAAGIYFLQAEQGGNQQMKKIIVTK